MKWNISTCRNGNSNNLLKQINKVWTFGLNFLIGLIKTNPLSEYHLDYYVDLAKDNEVTMGWHRTKVSKHICSWIREQNKNVKNTTNQKKKLNDLMKARLLPEDWAKAKKAIETPLRCFICVGYNFFLGYNNSYISTFLSQ